MRSTRSRALAGAAFALLVLAALPGVSAVVGRPVAETTPTADEDAASAEKAEGRWETLFTLPGADDEPTVIKAFSGEDVWVFTRYEFNDDEAEIWEQPRPRGYHWDGGSWRRVPFPAGQTGVVGEAVGASGSDLWISVTGLYDASDSMQGILRWNGGSWSVSKRLEDGSSFFPFGLTTLSDGGALAFAQLRPEVNSVEMLRYEDRAWTVQKTGVAMFVPPAVVSGHDIWAIGSAGEGEDAETVFHYDGSSWKRTAPERGVSTPGIRMCEEGEWPGRNTFPCLTSNSGLRQIAAGPEGDVVLAVGLERYDSAHELVYLTRLLRWDGARWVRLGGDVRRAAGLLIPDGSGGLWFVVSDSDGQHIALLHRTEEGRLLRYPLPEKQVSIKGMAVAPDGTVYATGTTLEGGEERSGVWRLTP